MKRRRQFIIKLCAFIVSGLVIKYAFPPRGNATPVQNGASVGVTTNPPLIAVANSTTSTAPVTTVLPPIAPPPVEHGTQVTPTGAVIVQQGADGKETIPADGKEAIPPVGELINSQSHMVDPSQNGPPVEHQNTNNPADNPLLNPPNPQNVGGPVVSAEAPSPE